MFSQFANRLELTRWGKAYAWNDQQRQALEYYPMQPEVRDGAAALWYPKRSKDNTAWHLGFEWMEPREVAGVEIVYADAVHTPNAEDVRIEYWNTRWPTPMPERWQGARSGWNETEDPRQGQWIWARGEVQAEGLTQQFTFDPIDVAEINDDRRIEWAEEYNVTYRKTLKVRVTVKGNIVPVIAAMHVYSTAVLAAQQVEIRLACDGAAKDWSGSLHVHNGAVETLNAIDFEGGDGLAGADFVCHTTGQPKGLRLQLQKSLGSAAHGDQTLVTLHTKAHSFTFRVADLETGDIWIPDYGVLASQPLKDGDWQQAIQKTQTGARRIYDRVPEEPEQSYERASSEMPALDVTKQAPYGRYVILGWEGVKQKFALRYNGEVFADKRQVKMCGRDTAKVRWAGNDIHFRFGTGDPVDFRQRSGASVQHMPKPQVPVYVTQWLDREIEFTQTAFAVLDNGPVQGPDALNGDEQLTAMIRLDIRNTTEGTKKALVYLDITPAEQLALDGDDVLAIGRLVPSETVTDGWKVQNYAQPAYRLHVERGGKGVLNVQPLSEGGIVTRSQEIDHGHFVHFGDTMKPKTMTTHTPNALVYEVELPGFGSHQIDVVIPFTTYTLETGRALAARLRFEPQLTEVTAFWEGFHSRGTQFDLPDPTLNAFMQAVPWHVLMTATKDPISHQYVMPAGTYAYDVCGNEACMQIRLMDMLGYHAHAERYLDTFVKTQGAQMPDGNFTSQDGALVAVSFDAGKMTLGIFGYNLDHGCIMAAFAEHYQMTGDRAWLASVADTLVNACEFVIRERKATQTLLEDQNKSPFYGLLPMGHLEDNCEWHHWFAVNGQAYGGMIRVARALADIDHPQAQRLHEEAQAYLADILEALGRAVAESPVVRLMDGTYIPHVPTRAGLRGRDWGWFREAGYGALHLVDGLVLDAADERVTWLLQDQEDNIFVTRLYGRPVDLKKHWFSQGGVTIQANVLNNGLAYLQRDQTAHALRALYNNLGQHLYPDVLAFSEHPVAELGSGFGPFFKTPDESQFLVWLRNFLLREDADKLWLCQGAPARWFEHGKRIAMQGAASCFGPVNAVIESVAAKDEIRASITLATRTAPKEILLRLRHPQGKPMRSATVNGIPHVGFAPERELVILDGSLRKAEIIASY